VLISLIEFITVAEFNNLKRSCLLN